MKKTDSIVVRNASGRRQFIKTGAAFLLTGSSVAGAQEEEPLRYDCDSQGFAGQKSSEAAGNDSDTGPSADRPGCGRRKPPTMTHYKKKAPHDRGVNVKKVSV